MGVQRKKNANKNITSINLFLILNSPTGKIERQFIKMEDIRKWVKLLKQKNL